MATKTTKIKVIDPIKDQYKILKELNQRLKYISDVYYISFNNFIYMHSNVDFIEKVAIIKDNINLSEYKGIMYLPNELFSFTKEARISKLISTDLQSSILLGQNDNDEITIKLNRLYLPNEEIKEEDNINVNIIPKMYNKFYHYFNSLNELDFIEISQEDILSIVKNGIVMINNPLCTLLLSKNLFSSIKKEDKLSYHIFPSKEDTNKVYVIYKEEYEKISIYTLSAYLNM